MFKPKAATRTPPVPPTRTRPAATRALGSRGYNEEVQRPPKRNGNTSVTRALSRSLLVSLLVTAAVFFALRFLHLRADFPNFSPWSDWAKYTDEGWYGDAAIRHYLRGTWALPGDFNPGAALPVWPLLEAVVFRFTGVGIVAARTLTVVVFGCILLGSYLLLRGGTQARCGDHRLPRADLFAAFAVLLLAVSPYFYVFSRMAVLEPLLVLLTLLGLLLARRVGAHTQRWPKLLLEVAIGIDVALMIGTKTTAVALIPAIAFMLASACGWSRRSLLRGFTCAGGTALLLWTGYYLAFIRPRYLQDFRYLFSANSYTGMTRENAWATVTAAFSDIAWIGTGTAALLVAALLFTLVYRRAWRDPVITSLALWIAGYFAFLLYHANLQPRYYLVVAVPITLLVVRVANHAYAWQPRTVWLLAPAALAIALPGAVRTLHYVRHPEYSFQSAADQIQDVIEAEPNHSHTVLSISGSDLTLMTGLPSICDDFGTMELEDRIAAYRPGWFVAWNYVEDDKMEALAKFYRLTRVRDIPAMDDPDRNLLIVYRLDSKDGRKPRRGHARHG